jgi:hypothetical protein
VETLLARIGPVTSGPFGAMLTWLTRRLASGTTVVVITARDPRVHLPALRRLRRSGYSVELITIGPERAAHASRARSAGLPAQAAEVRPNAEFAETIVLGG